MYIADKKTGFFLGTTRLTPFLLLFATLRGPNQILEGFHVSCETKSASLLAKI